MPAPKGNKYYLLQKRHGKFMKYTVEEWRVKLLEYFEHMETQTWIKQEAIKSGDKVGQLVDIPIRVPLSYESLCAFAEIHPDTLRNYKSGKKPWKAYFDITTYACLIIDTQQFEGATVGAYNPNIIARKLGLVDKQELKGDPNNPLKHEHDVNAKVLLYLPDNGRESG